MLIFDKYKDSYQVEGYKQFDTTKPLVARFLNNAQPINLVDYDLRFECLKPDGHIVVDNDNLTVKNTCEIEMMLDKQVTVVGGLLKCQFVLLRKADGKQDTTFTFFIDVQKSAIDIERYSDSVITILENLNNSINEAIQTNSELRETNRIATETNQTLTQTNATATQTNNTLTQTNTTANQTNTTLRETNRVATQTNQALTQTNTNATNTNNTLSQTNTTATQTNQALTQTNATATQTNQTLTQTNADATQTNNTLTGNINQGRTLNQNLENNITNGTTLNNNLTQTNDTATEKKRQLDESIANAQNVVAGAELEDFSGTNIPDNETRVRLKHNGVYKVPVTRANAVFLPNGTDTIEGKLNTIDQVDRRTKDFFDNGGNIGGAVTFKTGVPTDAQVTITGRTISATGEALALKGDGTENLYFYHDAHWNIDAVIPGVDKKWNLGEAGRMFNDAHIGGVLYMSPSSITASAGYNRLPNGMIMQWGKVVTGNMDNDGAKSVQKDITFPIAFTNDVFAIYCNVTNNETSNGVSYIGDIVVNGRVGSLSTASLIIRNVTLQLAGTNSFEVKWLAIGN